MLRFVYFLAALATLIAPNSTEQTESHHFTIPRSRVVNIDMRTAFRKDSPILLDQHGNQFNAIKVIIHPSDVSALRLHIIFVSFAQQAAWKVQVYDVYGNLSQTIDAHWRRSQDGGIWTDRIPGSYAKVVATSSSGGSLLVDRYLFATTPSYPESIYGSDDRVSVLDGPLKWQNLAHAVARLRFIIPAGEATCTAFLFSSDLVMTNNHCIQAETDLDGVYLDFDYESNSSPIHTVICSKLEYTNFALDVSIIRLSASMTDRIPLKLGDSNSVANNASLAILEHGGGLPMQLSLTDCRVRGTSLKGQGSLVSDFGHTCDTVGGSSGAPVFDSTSGFVVGLHHFGFEDNDPNPVNQAVYMNKIIEAIPASLRVQVGLLVR